MNKRDLFDLMKNHVIVIYDGSCGFCNSSIRFILKQNPSQKLRFVAFQSDTGTLIRQELNINEEIDSIIVVDNHKYFTKSKAIFRILDHVPEHFLDFGLKLGVITR